MGMAAIWFRSQASCALAEGDGSGSSWRRFPSGCVPAGVARFAPAAQDVVELFLQAGARAVTGRPRGPCVLACCASGAAAAMSLSSPGRVLKASSGTPRSSFLARGKADDGVAAFDVVVEEVERLAGDVGFEPEGDFAEFDGEGVQVHAVDAVADDVADGLAEGGGARVVLRRCGRWRVRWRCGGRRRAGCGRSRRRCRRRGERAGLLPGQAF